MIGVDAEGPAAASNASDAQIEVAKCIREAKGDCLLAIKANAGAIFDDIAAYFDMDAAIEIGAGRLEIINKDIWSHRWVSKRNSSIEIREYYVAEAPGYLFNDSSWDNPNFYETRIRSRKRLKAACLFWRK
ncbi:MAG: hypothetical protein LBU32_24550 [Clostridiales bacterium]|jgi:hypothetical protein|nr:hypothetical protein [Clostridiales bacterium]